MKDNIVIRNVWKLKIMFTGMILCDFMSLDRRTILKRDL